MKLIFSHVQILFEYLQIWPFVLLSIWCRNLPSYAIWQWDVWAARWNFWIVWCIISFSKHTGFDNYSFQGSGTFGNFIHKTNYRCAGLPLSMCHMFLCLCFVLFIMGPNIRVPEILSANPELQGIAKRMVDTFYKNLSLSNELDPQESMYGEELLSMASSILVQVCSSIWLQLA